jgi:hypothetical protein
VTTGSQQDDRSDKGSRGFVSVVRSVLAAGFGVQSDRNRERDFESGNYRHFVIAGVVFTVLFVLAVVLVVRLVLHQAGA